MTNTNLSRLKKQIQNAPRKSAGGIFLDNSTKNALRSEMKAAELDGIIHIVDCAIHEKHFSLEDFWNENVFSVLTPQRIRLSLPESKLKELTDNLSGDNTETALRSAYFVKNYYSNPTSFENFDTLLRCFYLTAGRSLTVSGIERFISNQFKTAASKEAANEVATSLKSTVDKVAYSLSQHFEELAVIIHPRKFDPDACTENFHNLIDAKLQRTISEINANEKRQNLRNPQKLAELKAYTPQDALNDSRVLTLISPPLRASIGVTITTKLNSQELSDAQLVKFSPHIGIMACWDLNTAHLSVINPFFQRVQSSGYTLALLYLLKIKDDQSASRLCETLRKDHNKHGELNSRITKPIIEMAIKLFKLIEPEFQLADLNSRLDLISSSLKLSSISSDLI